MNILIVGASSGLGKEIFDQRIKKGEDIYAISRYSKDEVYEYQIKYSKKIIKVDLASIKEQKEINSLIENFPSLDQIYFTLGGGFGRKDIFPSFEDMMFVYKMNVIIVGSIIRALNLRRKLNNKSKICIISSIASNEVTASPTYSSAKSALNTFSKVMTKQKNKSFGSITNFICGAFEGNGTGFDRLKTNNLDAYKNFIKDRLPNGKPLSTHELALFIIKTMDFSTEILDGLTIKVDGNESFSI
tara:strand:- start:4 stop:735 length:732 start_codon:yes stop_codon:yes gene_type:complete